MRCQSSAVDLRDVWYDVDKKVPPDKPDRGDPLADAEPKHLVRTMRRASQAWRARATQSSFDGRGDCMRLWNIKRHCASKRWGMKAESAPTAILPHRCDRELTNTGRIDDRAQCLLPACNPPMGSSFLLDIKRSLAELEDTGTRCKQLRLQWPRTGHPRDWGSCRCASRCSDTFRPYCNPFRGD